MIRTAPSYALDRMVPSLSPTFAAIQLLRTRALIAQLVKVHVAENIDEAFALTYAAPG